MKRVGKILILTCLAAILSMLGVSCNFRPMQETGNVSYVRVYIDERILNVTEGFYDEHVYEDILGHDPGTYASGIAHPAYYRPEILRIALFNHDTGALEAERYLRNQGDDERGHFYDGYVILNPGVYDLIAYNFGTESTVIGDEYNGFLLNAHTNEISSSLTSKFKSRAADEIETKANESIRYDADNLFVTGAQGLTVKHHAAIDTLRTSTGEWYFRAENVVKSYYLQIGIVNAQYIASSVALLSGMSAGVRLLDGDNTTMGESTLYFGLNNGRYPSGYYPGIDDYRVIYTTFGTFGEMPLVEYNLKVSFEFITTYGQAYEETIDITREFQKEDAIERGWLILDYIINIPPPPDDPGSNTSGGMTPSVDEWGEVESDLDI